jgi:two-component system, cell cycle response regulator
VSFDKKPGLTMPGVREPLDSESKRSPYLTLLVGALPGQMYRFRNAVTTIGRSMDCDINLSDLGISRVHTRIERTDEGVEIVDLRSTNGVFVNGVEIEGRRVLADGDKIQLGPTVVLRFNMQDAVDEAFQRSQFEAMTRDALTGCFNRLYFDEELRREVSFARRGGGSLTVGMLDIDSFKSVNDTWGHAAGDKVLVEMTHKLRVMLREYDMLARIGGEEFALLMRATDLDVAEMVTERLRRGIEELRISVSGGREISISVSIGICSLSENLDARPEELIRTADLRLYAAKGAGRNRVVAGGHMPGVDRQETRPVLDDGKPSGIPARAVRVTGEPSLPLKGAATQEIPPRGDKETT